jgi:2,4-dienoyl-CoA reductase-like NADH-dependent reductase (Old Yellow Enzyme family)
VPFEHVLAPIEIAGCRIRNRIARTAHVTGLARGGIGEAFVAFHEARARGEVGLTVLEISSVHPSSPADIQGYDDAVLEGYARLLPRVHAQGMRVFQQLWHGGHHTLPLDGGPPWSASEVPSAVLGLVPHAMTQQEIAEVVRGFAAAARRCRLAGVDGVELHFAHGYLVGQFLSPLSNLRSDEYGGSFEKRMRLAREVLAAVRSAVGPGYPVGARLSAEEGAPGGIGVEDSIETALALEATGELDFLDVSLGSYLAFSKVIGAMDEPHAYELPLASRVTRAVRVPTLVTGRITSLAEADAIVASGQADLVSLVRATLADPDLVRKSREGRAAEVRPCIGCNQGCVGGLQGLPGRVGCIGNPRAGNETTVAEVERAPRALRVLVAGGGPAGLEAARTAALRGHSVVLHEEGAATGGQLRLARRAPLRGEIGDISDGLLRELRRLGVELRLGSRVDRALVAREKPDAVIVATGSRARMDGLQAACPGRRADGLESARVCSSRELLAGAVAPAPTALVLDDVGHYEAVGAAEFLLDSGAGVSFASRFERLMPLLDLTLQTEPTLARLHATGRFDFRGRRRLVRVGGGRALLRPLDGGPEEDLAAELVVLVAGSLPERSLADALAGEGCRVVVVGDARGPRYLQAAIHEAHHAARGL